MGRRSILAVALALAAAAPAAAAPKGVDAPLLLPGDAGTARVAADSSTWLVGARPGAGAQALARRSGARAVVTDPAPVFSVPRTRARAFADALRSRGLLVFAEPNRLSIRAQAPSPDPLSAAAGWRDFVVEPSTVPPAVTPGSPLLALVDSQLDATHPEFAGGNTRTLGGLPVTDLHGTATAATAAAPKNDVGILGVWPGMRALNVPLPSDRITCADSARQIGRSVSEGASVINMSYVATTPCFTEYVQLQKAFAKGVLPVAASGNEFTEGNPLTFPASLPHVVTVAAIGPDLRASFFSSASAAIDLSAPGENILTAVPVAFDEDGTKDGYQRLDGTSFAAPMVAAAAAWVRAARPSLSVDQLAQVVRLSARDLEAEGWDPNTGFGLLSVDRALAQATPPRDPMEPNDNMVFVDGRALGRASRPVFTGRTRKLLALLDQYEDPADVYRITVPGRSVVRAIVKPVFGNPDIAAFDRRAKSVDQTRFIIDQSTRAGTQTDTIALRNTSRRAVRAYLVTYIDTRTPGLDAGYRLTIRRYRR